MVLSETRPYPGPFDGVYPERSRMGSGQASPVKGVKGEGVWFWVTVTLEGM